MPSSTFDHENYYIQDAEKNISKINRSSAWYITHNLFFNEITPSIIAKNLGVIIGCNLKLDKYINATSKSSYHIKNIGRIRDCFKCLTNDCAAAIHALDK